MREEKVDGLRYLFDLQYNTAMVRGCSKYHTEAVTIPNTIYYEGEYFRVTSIDDEAFSGCDKIPAITIPESVTSIGEEAFRGCPNLRDVYCYAEEVPSAENRAFYGSYPEDATLHVPANSLEAYKTAAPWNNFGNIVVLLEDG